MFQIFLQSKQFYIHFYISLQSIIGNVFEENYNFGFKSISVRTHMQKLQSYKVTIIVLSPMPHLTCCYCLVFAYKMEIVAYWTIVVLKRGSITYNNFASKQIGLCGAERVAQKIEEWTLTMWQGHM
jgi:hypothetical protein